MLSLFCLFIYSFTSFTLGIYSQYSFIAFPTKQNKTEHNNYNYNYNDCCDYDDNDDDDETYYYYFAAVPTRSAVPSVVCILDDNGCDGDDYR